MIAALGRTHGLSFFSPRNLSLGAVLDSFLAEFLTPIFCSEISLHRKTDGGRSSSGADFILERRKGAEGSDRNRVRWEARVYVFFLICG